MMYKSFSTLIIFYFFTISGWGQVTADFTVNQSGGCNFLQVNFTDRSFSSAGSIVSWEWNLGGTTSRTKNPSRIFGNPGTFTICLTVLDDQGNSAQVCKEDLINVYAPPNAQFEIADSSLCAGAPLVFTDRSSSQNGAIVEWVWDINGQIGSKVDNMQPTPFSNTYPNQGTYTLSLTVKDDRGCIANYSLTDGLLVLEPPKIQVSAVDPVICNTPHITAINFVSDPQDDYDWNFSNGVSYTGNTPPDLVVLNNEAIDLELIVDRAGVCRDSISITNLVIPAHEVEFMSSAIEVCLGETIQFTDISSMPADSFTWIFDDGNFNNSQANPVHLYNTPGTYTPRLSRLIDDCWIEQAAMNPIVVLTSPEPDYTSSITLSCFPQNFIFFNDLTPNAVSWNWKFGANSEFGSSDQQNPAVAFNQFGTFPVQLEATLANGCSASIIKDTITIFEFEVDLSSSVAGCVPLNVNLEEQASTLSPTNDWLWTISGDTNFVFSSKQINFTLLEPGKLNIFLEVSNEAGCVDSVFVTDHVVGGTPPSVDFDVDRDTVCVGETIQFTDLSDTTINAWAWTFSDGTSSTRQNPMKSFTRPGTFDVTLRGSYNGCTNSRTRTASITVLNPLARFDFTYSCSTSELTFNSTSLGADSVFWDFGLTEFTNDTSTEFNPIFIYPEPGDYLVTLIAYSNSGCSHTIRDTVHVAGPIFDFMPDHITGCAPLNTLITNNSFDLDTVRYETIGGMIINTTDELTSIQYDGLGTFKPIRAITTDLNGCVDTLVISDSIQVDGVVGGWNFDKTTLCSRDTLNISFETNSQFTATNEVLWRINSDGWQQAIDPFVYVDTAATLSIEFYFSNAAGCADTISETMKIDHVRAQFEMDSLGCTFSPTQYINQSIGDSLKYQWVFSDGMNSNQIEPRIQFTRQENIISTLYAESLVGCSDSMSRIIPILDPVPNFTLDSNFAFCPPFEAIFDNKSSRALWYEWDFGDGSAVSTLTNPKHIYTTPGVYNVTLSVGHVTGCEITVRYDDAVTIGGPDGFFRTIRMDSSTCAPLPTRFVANFDGVYDLLWDYGDGNVEIVDDAIITFTNLYNYQQSGTFIPTLIMKDSLGCQRVFVDESIQVELINLNFNLSNDTVCSEDDLQIFNLSFAEDQIPDFEWNLISSDTTLNYRTLEPNIDQVPYGVYSVELIGEVGQCIDTLIRTNILTIGDTPRAIIGLSSINDCEPRAINFSDLSTVNAGTINSWTWYNSQDSIISTYNNYQNSFMAGIDSINLAISTVLGCADTATMVFETLPNVTSDIQDTITLCLREMAQLQAKLNDSISTSRFQWIDDPDLSCTDCLNPRLRSTAPKYYYFLAEHLNGCINIDSVFLDLKPDTVPSVSIVAAPIVCLGEPVQLNIAGHRMDYTYFWDSTRSGLNCYEDCFNPIARPTENTTYTLQVKNELGCIYEDSIQLSVLDPISNFAGVDQIICMGDTVQLNISAGINPQWHVSDGLTCSTCPNPIAQPNQSIQYIVSVIDGQNCTAFDTLSFEVIRPTQVNAGMDTSTCLGGDILLEGIGPGDISWQSNQRILGISNSRQIIARPLQSDYFYFTSDTGSCSVTDSVWVEVTDRVNIEGLDRSVCMGDTIILSVKGSVESVDWLDPIVQQIDERTGEIVAQASNTYVAIGRIGQCIPDTALINIRVNDMPDFGLPSILTMFDQPIQLFLNNSPSITYSWFPPEGVSCQDCNNPQIIPIEGIDQYFVSAVDLLTGCSLNQEVNLVKLNTCSRNLVGVPNIFSPNQDGFNDEFKIITSLPQITSLEVYDRWGNLLFQTADKDFGWNGKLGQDDTRPGVYVYRLQFTCPSTNENILVVGDITLIR